MPPKCIFCEVINGNTQSEIVLQTDDVIVFKDIRPASKHHLLACPTRHIKDAKQLTKSDAPTVELVVREGLRAMEGLGAAADDIRIGVHWPPFTRVAHLHVHLISPQAEMGWLGRAIFRPNSYWFVSVDSVLDYARSRPDN